MAFLPWLAWVLFAMGCEPYPPVAKQEGLNTLTAPEAAKTGPNCAQCHTYPLRDVHHGYHLIAFNTQHVQVENHLLNGRITCLDCHFTSLSSLAFPALDTVWVDINGNDVESPELPTDRILRIDTFTQYRPIPYEVALAGTPQEKSRRIDSLAEHAAEMGEVLAWLTGSTHQNGKVEVNFPPNNAMYPDSAGAIYRPRDLSCSMVACHQNGDRYRWADPSRGLGQCPSIDVGDTSCLKSQPGSP